MAKSLDDNDLAVAGLLGSYFDGVEEVRPSIPPPPASGPQPRSNVRLLSAREAELAIGRALHSSAPCVLLRSTTGAGKSAATRSYLREYLRRRGARAIVILPTHALAAQTVTELGTLGTNASAPMGVARVRLPLVGGQGEQPACLHHEAAELLAQTGARVREELCQGCDAREEHPATRGECPAFASGAEQAPVMVLQHASAASALHEQTKLLLAPVRPKNKHPARLFIFDEPPALTLRSSLVGARREYEAQGLSGELRPDVRARLEPLLLAVLSSVEGGAQDGSSLRALLAHGGASHETIEAMLAYARSVEHEPLWRVNLPTILARSVFAPSTRQRGMVRLAVVARFSSLLAALIDAAHHPDAPALHLEEDASATLVTRARWTRYVGPYLAAGGKVRLLDATAHTEALSVVLGSDLEVHQVDVADAPGVERRAVIWQHGAKGKHTSQGHVIEDQVRGPLRRVADAAQERTARRVGLLTDKATADDLRAWLHDREADRSKPAPAFVPDELTTLLEQGVELSVGHYGAQRGLDTWKDCDALVTLGDPWPNLGAARAEARCLGLDPEGWALEQLRAELTQAWGRARTVHRNNPVLVLHLGSKASMPEPSWAPQWQGVKPEQTASGRPRTVLPLTDPSSWASERERLGLSARQHAAAMGLSWGTYSRRMKETAQDAKAPGGGSEPGEPPKTPQETVAHNWAPEVSGVSPLSSVPNYGPPNSAGFDGPVRQDEPPAEVASEEPSPGSTPCTQGFASSMSSSVRPSVAHCRPVRPPTWWGAA